MEGLKAEAEDGQEQKMYRGSKSSFSAKTSTFSKRPPFSELPLIQPVRRLVLLCV